MDDLLKLYSSFINSFDGTPGAFERAEPIMDKLFDPSLTLITDDGPKDLDWYRSFAKSFATEVGNTAKVTHIKPTPQGIQVTIKNVVAGIELDLITSMERQRRMRMGSLGSHTLNLQAKMIHQVRINILRMLGRWFN